MAAAAWAAERSSALARGRNTSPGLGQPGALRGAVEQAGAELLLQAADLAAQRRLRDEQVGGGAAEVAVRGDDGEVPDQAQVEVGRRRAGPGRAARLAAGTRFRLIDRTQGIAHWQRDLVMRTELW